MDYLNNDSAPNLLKFMQIKIGQKKTYSYYGFLKGIEEENIDEFDKEQENVINYLSGLLQLVRPHDYLICKMLLNGKNSINFIVKEIKNEIVNYNQNEFDHALKYLIKNNVVRKDGDTILLNGAVTTAYKNYLEDLIEYGLTKYKTDYSESTDMFILWKDYRYDQVQLKRCEDPKNNQKGTYFGSNGVIYIFASIKKDVPDDKEHLNYKDKFLESSLFQWESMANIKDVDLEKLNTSKYAHLFIRKMESENGILMPFTYVGKGHLDNPRKSKNVDSKRSFIYDIRMENELPDYLQYDFGVIN